jgi:hypothetical protein
VGVKQRDFRGGGRPFHEYPKTGFRGTWATLGTIPEWASKEGAELSELKHIQRRLLKSRETPHGHFMNDDTADRLLRSQLWWRNYMRERRRGDA